MSASTGHLEEMQLKPYFGVIDASWWEQEGKDFKCLLTSLGLQKQDCACAQQGLGFNGLDQRTQGTLSFSKYLAHLLKIVVSRTTEFFWLMPLSSICMNVSLSTVSQEMLKLSCVSQLLLTGLGLLQWWLILLFGCSSSSSSAPGLRAGFSWCLQVKGWEQQWIDPSLFCFVSSGTVLVSDDWRSQAKLTDPQV